MPRRPTRRALAALAASATVLAACGGTGDGGGRPDTLLVFAAGSLAGAFADLEAAFEAAHPGVDVEVAVAGSSSLREQILEGAPADVFASADPENMAPVQAAGLTAADPVVFAHNTMEIAVPAGNPAGITGLADFADPARVIGLCAAQVPCGAFALRVLANAGIEPSVDTAEPNVLFLLAKIEAGELDAGLVYATDVAGSSAVEGIAVPDRWNVVAEYPIAALAGSRDPAAAAAFVSFVLSAEGRRILAAHGFGVP